MKQKKNGTWVSWNENLKYNYKTKYTIATEEELQEAGLNAQTYVLEIEHSGMESNEDVLNKSIKFYLKGDNLLDEEKRDHTSFLKDKVLMGGRSIMLGVTGDF